MNEHEPQIATKPESQEIWSGEVKVEGAFWVGKKSTTDDYDTHENIGEDFVTDKEIPYRLMRVLQRVEQKAIAVIYQMPQENRRECFFATVENWTDAAGRISHHTNALKTTSGVNVAAELVELRLTNGSRETRFSIGESISVSDRAKKILTEQPPATSSDNEILATILFGENAEVPLAEVIQITRSSEKSNLIPWIMFLGNHDPSGVVDEETIEKGKPALIVGHPKTRLGEYNSKECNEFVVKVKEKFGSRDAKLELLIKSIQDQKKRLEIIKALLESNFSNITSDHKDAILWLEAVGTQEEIEKAKHAIGN